MVLRKLLRNRWLAACLLAGTIVAVALVASIPMYTAGILQRMLTRDLETFQERQHYYTGRYTVYGNVRPTASSSPYPGIDSEICGSLAEDLRLPVLSFTRLITLDSFRAVPRAPGSGEEEERFLELAALSDAPEHVSIVRGRAYGTEVVDGAIEAIASPQAMVRCNLLLGETYELQDAAGFLSEPLAVRVVGVYEVKDLEDLWWFQSPGNYDNTLLADFGLLRLSFGDPQSPLLSYGMWSFAFDYHAITLGNLGVTTRTLERQLERIEEAGLGCDSHMLPILRQYVERKRELETTLWFLQIPVLILLFFYVYMVSLLIIGSERTEIALLKSRGASGRQVLVVYLLESSLLAAVALLAGPPLGLLVCRVLGASNGFLEFVQRAPLETGLSVTAYLYAAACSAVLSLAMLIPAASAARTTIVVHKQRRARNKPRAGWRRYGVDIGLLALTGVGYYGYRLRWIAAGLGMEGLPLDPLLFLVSTTFVLGAGLLFLRLYPLLVRLLFRIGRRFWPPGMYATILGIGRSGGWEQFIMLFLILTLSVGILDARAARTINRNAAETIEYAGGADVVLQEHWPTNRPPAAAAGPPAPVAAAESQAAAPLMYIEPDFGKYSFVDGVELATRVFRTAEAICVAGTGRSTRVSVMGIVPQEFAEVAWFRPNLLPPHWYAYLDLLARNPNAFIVAEPSTAKLEASVGDALNVTWSEQGYLDGVVCAVVPYWPTYDPYAQTESAALVVANLSYVQAKMATEPYEVWLKKAPGATSAEVYDSLARNGIEIEYLEDTAPKLIAARNDPLLQGTNGALTLGFVVTMVVCLVGFLVYWIIAVESRLLQYGVFRAMGLSERALVGMIAWEQLLVTLVAVAAGIVTGGVAADLFVPLLELTRSTPHVPPFAVTAVPGDYVRLYIIIGVMLAAGMAVVGVRLSRIRMAQAIKLGED